MNLSDHKNSRKQGDHGLGAAIAYFASIGWCVNIPLTDSQPYDLIVDDGANLLKVQVKTATHKRDNYFQAYIKTCGGNQSFSTVKYFDSTLVDYLFILTTNNEKYLIPTYKITAKTHLQLGPKYKNYLIQNASVS